MANRDLLTAEEIAPRMAQLNGWKVEGKELVRRFDFRDFLGPVGFVNRIAAVAEEMNHHPDLEVGWGRVVVRLSTHSSNGLTALDFALATAIDGVADV
ncbi:MAG: 4a-hydroxytetrahydrobiopterin dehydratase [Chloroflexota bacterium]|nr:4a-hydroxytetrahydrobiopterin dehydratase [Chloroflexota bacterium]